LTGVNEIGPKIAASIVSYFSDPDNLETIKRLKKAGIKFSSNEESIKTGNLLDGKTIVISGVFQKYSRDEYKELIESNGGKNSSSVSRSTTFILAGDNMGESKKEKATELGVPMISEPDFLKLIGK
jgi:DNA ligase (NAD+)